MASSGAPEICRVCSIQRDSLHSVWDWCKDRQITELMLRILEIEVRENFQSKFCLCNHFRQQIVSNDGLSQKICCRCLEILEDANKLRIDAKNNEVKLRLNHRPETEAETVSPHPDDTWSDYQAIPAHRDTSYATTYNYPEHTPMMMPFVPFAPSPDCFYFPAATQLMPMNFVHHQDQEPSCPIPIPAPRGATNHSLSTSFFNRPPHQVNFDDLELENPETTASLQSESDVETEYEPIEEDEAENEQSNSNGSSEVEETKYEPDGHPGSSFIGDSELNDDCDEESVNPQASKSVDSVELPHYQLFRSYLSSNRASTVSSLYLDQKPDEARNSDVEPDSDQDELSDGEAYYAIEFK